MFTSDELSAVLRKAISLAAASQSRLVETTHLVAALLAQDQPAADAHVAEQPCEFSPPVIRAVRRAKRLAAEDGCRLTERRHLVMALTEVGSQHVREALAGIGPMTDRPAEMAPGQVVVHEAASALNGSVSVTHIGSKDL
jgi:ATP-dependent Clp protease ATP-binding subunit ClpA